MRARASCRLSKLTLVAGAATLTAFTVFATVAAFFAWALFLGEWSPEATGASSVKGSLQVGDTFRGHNKRGLIRWYTHCTVREAQPGRKFVFDVDSGPMPVSRWTYTFEPTATGCRLTETWDDRRFGPLGPLVFVLAFTVIQPLGPSSHIFVLAASLVWDPAEAFALSLAGAVGAQLVMFVFFRYVASDWARQRLPNRLLRWEERLVARPFRTVFTLRALTFGWHLSAMVIGVSRVPFGPMFGGTVLGLMVPIAFDIFALDTVRAWLA